MPPVTQQSDQSNEILKGVRLRAQVRQLKEMVILPLLYPALMAHMHITPPRSAHSP